MLDVRLLYPTEKLEAAARLAEAIEAAGYSVERQALADVAVFPHFSADTVGAKAVLLVWSRGLVTAAMNGGLSEARRHPNLIEVSVDGIEPAVGAESSPVVLLSGWRGQPYHLGWQRILAEIKRLSGPRGAPGKSAGTIPADSAGRSPVGATRPFVSRRTSVRAAVAAGALLAATLGAATALNWGGPGSAPDSRARSEAAPYASPPAASVPVPAAVESEIAVQPVAGTSASDALPLPVPAAAPTSLQPVRSPSSGASPPPSASAGSASERRAAAPAEARGQVAARRSSAKRLALTARPEAKRYSRKYSKTMRLFCQRSGRSTPQCRTFARSMRDQRS